MASHSSNPDHGTVTLSFAAGDIGPVDDDPNRPARRWVRDFSGERITHLSLWTSHNRQMHAASDALGRITIPEVSVRRGGITYPTPNSPTAVRARAAAAEQEERLVRWRKNAPEPRVQMNIWLAIKDYGDYDEGEELLEVCSSPQRATAVCTHHAARPSPAHPDGRAINWRPETATSRTGTTGYDHYRIERSELRG